MVAGRAKPTHLLLLVSTAFRLLPPLSTTLHLAPSHFASGFSNLEPLALANHRQHRHPLTSGKMSREETPKPCDGAVPHPFSALPGDPSMILVTNLDLGGEKLNIMKAISKAMAKHTGKPESYIAVSITDKADVIFGGSDAPAALANMYSIGAIAMESNGAITRDVTELLESHGLAEDRIYINFFDVPRANVGWSKRTFAG